MNPCLIPAPVVTRTAARFGGLAVVLAAMLSVGSANAWAQKNKPQTFNVVPITITSVTAQPGGLVANGVIGSSPFSAPITLTPLTLGTATTCPVLDLSLGPIHLSLLGLNVDTSMICLKVTAHQGGGLLGDLLCGIANLLNQGLTIDQALATLDATQLGTLDAGLTNLLNTAVFQPLTSSTAVASATCSVLNLSLGPLHLNLLGLAVDLDNCAGGPVTLSVTATQGGGLLGDLLCGLSNVLKGPANQNAVLVLLRQITAVLGQLLG